MLLFRNKQFEINDIIFFRLAVEYSIKKQNKTFNCKLKIVNASVIIQKFVT